MMLRLALSLVFAAATLSACGSGGGKLSDGGDPSPDGIAPDANAADVDAPALSDGGSASDGGSLVVSAAGSALGTVAIAPDGGTTLTVLDQLRVEVPSGSASPAATLAITGGTTPYVMLPWAPIQSYNITLTERGVAVQPLAPITLRFRVFPEFLRSDVKAEDQLVAATLNEITADWSELPFQLEADALGAQWMVVTAPHLTTFAQFIIGPSQSVLSTPYWRILFDPNIDGVGLGATSIESLAVAYRAVLDTAHDAYAAAGFTDPRLPPTSWTKVSVYLQPMVNEGALYNPLTGNILLNTFVASDAESRYEAAHEVFHIFQNAQINAESMGNRKWFVEAAAAYAGDELAVHNRYLAKLIKPNFLKDPIDTSDGKHEYGLGSFIKWAVDRGLSFKFLQDSVFAAWNYSDGARTAFADAVVASVGGDCTGSTFAQKYLCFAEYLLTDASTPLVGASISQAVANSSCELGANDNGTGGSLAVGPWTAGVWAAKIHSARAVRLIYSNMSGSCNFDAFLVHGDNPGNGQKLVRKTYVTDHGTDNGFEDIDAGDGDTIVVLATSPDQCSLSLEARDAKTCTQTAFDYDVAYECKDSAGTHTLAEVPSCLSAGTIGYHSYTCSAAYGPTARCIDSYYELTCSEGTSCTPVSGGVYALPLCRASF